MDNNSFLIENGIDIFINTIYYSGIIENDFSEIIRGKSEILLQYSETKSITLNLTSSGGDILSIFPFENLIKHYSDLGIKFNIVANGICFSTAIFILLLASGNKMAFPNTKFKLHRTESLVGINDIIKVNMESINSIIIERIESKQKDEDVMRYFDGKYFDVNVAKKLRIIDRIIN